MDDQTRETLIDQGDRDPLHATRRPSTANKVEEVPPFVAQILPQGDVDHGQDRFSKERR